MEYLIYIIRIFNIFNFLIITFSLLHHYLFLILNNSYCHEIYLKNEFRTKRIS